jgi:hypothetical protein
MWLYYIGECGYIIYAALVLSTLIDSGSVHMQVASIMLSNDE